MASIPDLGLPQFSEVADELGVSQGSGSIDSPWPSNLLDSKPHDRVQASRLVYCRLSSWLHVSSTSFATIVAVNTGEIVAALLEPTANSPPSGVASNAGTYVPTWPIAPLPKHVVADLPAKLPRTELTLLCLGRWHYFLYIRTFSFYFLSNTFSINRVPRVSYRLSSGTSRATIGRGAGNDRPAVCRYIHYLRYTTYITRAIYERTNPPFAS